MNDFLLDLGGEKKGGLDLLLSILSGNKYNGKTPRNDHVGGAYV